MTSQNSTIYQIKVSGGLKFWAVISAILLLLSLIAPPLFLFSLPIAIWNALSIISASKHHLVIVGDELHYKRGKRSRVIKLNKLTTLSTNLGSAGSKSQREGVGTLAIANEAGDNLMITRVTNCIALMESIKAVSGPVIAPKKAVEIEKSPAQPLVSDSMASKSSNPTWSNTAPSISGVSQEQFEIILPGYAGRSTDLAGLMLLVNTGVLRANVSVKEVRTGNVFLAKQVPGLFSSKEYVTALVLSVLVGGLGVDRFYLGYTGLGIAKLLTFGGLGVWTIIDLILIAMRKVPDSNGAPLS